jgi:inner membrane protein
MDFSNNYGVHPFWPAYSGWFYGDFIFIVEPWFLVIGLAVLSFTFETTIARSVAGVLLAGAVLLMWRVSFVPWQVGAFGTFLALVSLCAAWRLSPGRRIAFGIGGCLVVAMTFGAAHASAKTALQVSLPHDARVEDLVLTPSPGNPLCWSAWRVSSAGDRYLAERAVVAAWPTLSSVRNCKTESDSDETTAPIASRNRFEGDSVHFTGEYRASLAELSTLARRQCTFAAFLRYARVPFWIDSAQKTVMGDLRYDRNPRLEFAELEASKGAPCPRWLPNWTPPRARLLH